MWVIMNMNIKKNCFYMFAFLCVVTTFIMCAYWCYKFSSNEDSSVVTYRKFGKRTNDIRPTISMCLNNLVVERRLSRYGVNESAYLSFLKGKTFSKEMLKVDFNDITIDVADYIKGYRMYFKNGSIIKFDDNLAFEDKKSLTHVSFTGITGVYGRFYKCFALNIPQIEGLSIFRILLSNKIFPKGLRPTIYGLMTFVHLPKQFLLTELDKRRWVWPYRGTNESYKMRFLIDDVTIERKRNKKSDTCNDYWKNHDDWITMLHKNETRCNTPYQALHKELPMCDTQEKMRRALFDHYIMENKMYEKPCKTMESFREDYLESTLETKSEGVFWFSISFASGRFKEIEQIR